MRGAFPPCIPRIYAHAFTPYFVMYRLGCTHFSKIHVLLRSTPIVYDKFTFLSQNFGLSCMGKRKLCGSKRGKIKLLRHLMHFPNIKFCVNPFKTH
jgi:hypothetical protein